MCLQNGNALQARQKEILSGPAIQGSDEAMVVEGGVPGAGGGGGRHVPPRKRSLVRFDAFLWDLILFVLAKKGRKTTLKSTRVHRIYVEDYFLYLYAYCLVLNGVFSVSSYLRTVRVAEWLAFLTLDYGRVIAQSGFHNRRSIILQ